MTAEKAPDHSSTPSEHDLKESFLIQLAYANRFTRTLEKDLREIKATIKRLYKQKEYATKALIKKDINDNRMVILHDLDKKIVHAENQKLAIDSHLQTCRRIQMQHENRIKILELEHKKKPLVKSLTIAEREFERLSHEDMMEKDGLDREQHPRDMHDFLRQQMDLRNEIHKIDQEIRMLQGTFEPRKSHQELRAAVQKLTRTPVDDFDDILKHIQEDLDSESFNLGRLRNTRQQGEDDVELER